MDSFLSSSTGPNNYVACEQSTGNTFGNIYINNNNTGIYYSNDGGINAFSVPSLTTVPCGYLICATDQTDNVMTINGSNINYSSDKGINYNTNNVTNNISSIIYSYDASIVTITYTNGNIYQSITGPSGTFNIMTGYPAELTFTNIASKDNSSVMVVSTTNNILFYFTEEVCILEDSLLEIYDINKSKNRKYIKDVRKGDMIKIYGRIIDDEKIEMFPEDFEKKVEIKWIGKQEGSNKNPNYWPICIENYLEETGLEIMCHKNIESSGIINL